MAAEAKKRPPTTHDLPYNSPLWKSAHKESKAYRRRHVTQDETSFHSPLTQPYSVSRTKSDDVISYPLQNKTSLSPFHIPQKTNIGTMDPEVLINGGVKNVLRTYTEKSAKPNVKEINEKVTWIYGIVDKAVADILKTVTMQHGGSAYESIEYTVIPPSIVSTFKGSDEEKNLPASCSSTPTTSPTPCSSSSNRQDSVETNTSGPHSTSSRETSHSSVKTNASAPQSASHDNNENTSATITDNTSLVAQPHRCVPESLNEVKHTYSYI